MERCYWKKSLVLWKVGVSVFLVTVISTPNAGEIQEPIPYLQHRKFLLEKINYGKFLMIIRVSQHWPNNSTISYTFPNT